MLLVVKSTDPRAKGANIAPIAGLDKKKVQCIFLLFVFEWIHILGVPGPLVIGTINVVIDGKRSGIVGLYLKEVIVD